MGECKGPRKPLWLDHTSWRAVRQACQRQEEAECPVPDGFVYASREQCPSRMTSSRSSSSTSPVAYCTLQAAGD